MAGANLNLGGLFGTVGAIQDRLDGDVQYRIVTNVEYAIDVHFGTSEQSAQPFLTEAAHAVQPQVPGIVAGASSTKAAVQEVALACLAKAKEYCPVDTGVLRASIRVEEVGGGTLGEVSGSVDLGTGEVSV